MKARESKFSISRAPSSRARCRACKGVIEKGDLRIMTLVAVSSWPMPRRSVSLARHARCVTPVCGSSVESSRGGEEGTGTGPGTGGRGVDRRGAGVCERGSGESGLVKTLQVKQTHSTIYSLAAGALSRIS